MPTAARAAFEELAEKWGNRYPAVIRLWENAWEEFIPFLDYGACRRIAERSGRPELIWRGRRPDRWAWCGLRLGAVRPLAAR